MRGRPLALLLTVSAPWCLRAQEADTLSAARVSGIRALGADRPAEEVFLPAAAAPPAGVAEVLSRFTGVQVKDYGGAGGLKTVNVRSLGSEHVGVFLDGIPIDNAQNMQVDLGRFSTDGLGTVSLYNGQPSRRLQTARAYAAGAAVHLDGQRPVRPGGSVRLRGGSLGTVSPSLQWDCPLGPRLFLRTRAAYLASNGRYKYPCFDTTLVRENGDIQSLRLEAQLFGQLRSGDWQVHLYSYGSERGFPGPVIRRALGFPFSAERQADQDLFLQGSWQQAWTERYATALRLKYSNSYTHYNTHAERNPMAFPYDLHYRLQSGYLSLAQSCVLAGPWSADLSTDLQTEALSADTGGFVWPRRTTLTAALGTQLAWEHLSVAAHLVYMGAWDRYDRPSAGGWSREARYRDAWMPALHLLWRPAGGLEAGVFARRSYRLPSFNDLYYTLIGNAGLTPEAASQLGMDLRWDGSCGALSWAVRAAPYLSRVEEKIVAIPTASQFRWTMLNIGRVDITGMDLRLGIDWSRGDWALGAVARYSFQQALDHSQEGSAVYGNQIPYIPLHSGSLGAGVRFRRWSLDWDTRVSGGKWSRTANTPDYYIHPWCLSDAALSCRFDLGALRSLTVSLRVDNLFNTPYQIVQGYPMPGCSALMSVGFNW